MVHLYFDVMFQLNSVHSGMPRFLIMSEKKLFKIVAVFFRYLQRRCLLQDLFSIRNNIIFNRGFTAIQKSLFSSKFSEQNPQNIPSYFFAEV